MPTDIKEIVKPAHTAILVIECQEGVIGDYAPAALKPIADSVRATGMVPRLAKLLAIARSAGVRIFYAPAELRADGQGRMPNCPLDRAMEREGPRMVRGTPPARILSALAPDERDFIVPRIHGMAPFHGTELDSLLRNLGIKTLIVTGVSINIAVPTTVVEAVNNCYNAVVPADCVAGAPPEYGEAVLKYSLRLLALVTTAR